MTNPPEILGKGRFLQLLNDNGWEYAERTKANGVVAIIAVTTDQKLILTEQYRPAVKGRVIDLPAGLSGDGHNNHDEDLAIAAKRELLEECGYEAEEMHNLFHGPSSAGLTSEIVTFFRAEGLTKINAGGGDESEDIQVLEIPLKEITNWLQQQITTNKHIDPKIIAALYFVSQ